MGVGDDRERNKIVRVCEVIGFNIGKAEYGKKKLNKTIINYII